jgi:hypothetical protein
MRGANDWTSLALPMLLNGLSITKGTNRQLQQEKRSMSIEKKSLISTLKTTKKANIAKDDFSVSPATVSAVHKAPVQKAAVQKAAVQKAAVQKAAVQKAAVQKAAVQKAAVQKAAVRKG